MKVAANSVKSVTSDPPEVTHDLRRLREAVGSAVGSMFFGTLLKTMRESRIRGMYGHGGRGEEIFAAQLHDVYAQRLGQNLKGGPAEAVYRRLEAQQRRISRNHGLDLEV
jgi:Rod binding domain-containing protein